MIVQHVIVLTLVAACVAVFLRGIIRTIRQQRGGIGKCCEKGCGDPSFPSPHASKPQVAFIPVSRLRKN